MGLCLYLVAFYAGRLPSLEPALTGGRPLSRAGLAARALLLVDEVVAAWFGDPPDPALADRLPILLVTACLMAASLSIGWLCLSALRIDELLDRLETWVFSLGVGLQWISTATLLLGLAGQIRRPWLLASMLAVPILLASWRVRRQSGRAGPSPWLAEPLPLSNGGAGSGQNGDRPLPTMWLLAALPFGLVILLGGMLPPIDFDVREYHLQAPKEFFQLGRVTFLPHNVYANMPLGPQMHSLLAMALLDDWWQGALVGKLLMALYVPFTTMALLSAGSRFFGRTAGIVAAVTYVSVPWMVRVSNLGLVEGPYAMFLFLAAYSVVRYRQSRVDGFGTMERPDAGDGIRTAHATESPAPGRPGRALLRPPTSTYRGASQIEPKKKCAAASGDCRWLILAGFTAGGAISCKYPAVVMVFLPLAGTIVWMDRGRSFRPLAVYSLAAVLACGVWFAKNAYFTGNPTYPLFSTLFPTEHWSRESAARWQAVHGPGRRSIDEAISSMANITIGSPWLSPLVVPLAACTLLTRRDRNRAGFWWACFAVVIVAWWLLTHRIDRFWIPVMPVLCLLAGAGAAWSSAPLWGWTLRGVLLLGLSTSLLTVLSGPGGYNRFFVSLANLRQSDERVDRWHLRLNRQVPPGHRLLVVADAEVFDLEMSLLYNTVFDESILEMAARNRSAGQLHAWLIERDVSHIFVHWGEVARYRSPGNYGMTDFVRRDWFREMVKQGVLADPEPPIDGHPGEVYTVLAPPAGDPVLQPRRPVGVGVGKGGKGQHRE
jgi:4-amino-4-deoxy-L-arabinose transferase-like glycosyltransferase